MKLIVDIIVSTIKVYSAFYVPDDMLSSGITMKNMIKVFTFILAGSGEGKAHMRVKI